MNGRLDSLQAAVLLAKLGALDAEIGSRRRIAGEYTERLKGALCTPTEPEGFLTCWAQYTLRAQDEKQRDIIVRTLKERGSPVMIYYSTPVHLSAAYAHLRYFRGDRPVAEALSRMVFSIPIHPYLWPEEIENICDTVLEVVHE